MAELYQEQLEDLLMEKEDLEERLSGDGFTGDPSALQSRLASINRALGETGGGDDLLDYWDAEIKAGRIPDLDMTDDDLAALRSSE